MASGVVWGIDVGKASLKAVKARKTKTGIDILGVEFIGFGPVGEASEASDKVREAVKTFLDRNPIGANDRVAVALPGYTAFSRFIKLPTVDPKKIDEMVRYEAQQQIPFPIEEVNWDYQLLEPDPEEPDEREIGIFAIRQELLAGFLSELRMQGIEPDLVTIASLSIYNFVRYNQSLDGAAVIVDIGAEHTDLVIMDGPRFWIRSLRIAGNEVTKGLQEKFKIPFAEAEKLKKQASKSKEAKKIFGVMEPVLKDFVGEVQRSIGFYKSQAKNLKINHMILLGDGARLINLRPFLRKELGYEVEMVTKLENMELDPDIDFDALKSHLSAFSVAFGLALQSAGSTTNCINLLPKEQQLQSELKQKKPLAIAAAVLAVIALLIFYQSQSSKLTAVQATVSAAKKVNEYTEKEAQILGLQDDMPAKRALVADKIAMVGKRLLPLELLNKVTGVFESHGSASGGNGVQWEIPETVRGRHFRRQKEEVVNHYLDYERAKLWLIDLKLERIDGVRAWENAETGEPMQTEEGLRVDLVLALSEHNSNRERSLEIINRFLRDELLRKLKGDPFHVRAVLDSDLAVERRPEDPWKVAIETDSAFTKEIWALVPNMTNKAQEPSELSLKLRQFKVSFEVGIAPPPEPEDPEGE